MVVLLLICQNIPQLGVSEREVGEKDFIVMGPCGQ